MPLAIDENCLKTPAMAYPHREQPLARLGHVAQRHKAMQGERENNQRRAPRAGGSVAEGGEERGGRERREHTGTKLKLPFPACQNFSAPRP